MKNIKNIIRIGLLVLLAMYVIAWIVFGYKVMVIFTVIASAVMLLLLKICFIICDKVSEEGNFFNMKNIIRLVLFAMYLIAWMVFSYQVMIKFTLIFIAIMLALIVVGQILYVIGDKIPKIVECYIKLLEFFCG